MLRYQLENSIVKRNTSEDGILLLLPSSTKTTVIASMQMQIYIPIQIMKYNGGQIAINTAYFPRIDEYLRHELLFLLVGTYTQFIKSKGEANTTLLSESSRLLRTSLTFPSQRCKPFFLRCELDAHAVARRTITQDATLVFYFFLLFFECDRYRRVCKISP